MKLQTWQFAIVKIEKLNEIRKKISEVTQEEKLKYLDLTFREFKIPGTLQSNLARLEDLKPYFEKNMEYFSSLENDGLLLICKLPKLELDNDYTLKFRWIDTNADIYLNGIKISSSSNAFIDKTIFVPKDILTNSNLLVVLLYPHLIFVDKDTDLPMHSPADRVFVRRPIYNYGWDFAPRVLLLGIGETFIEKKTLFVRNIFVQTKTIKENEAELEVEWEVESDLDQEVNFIIEIMEESCKEVIQKIELATKLKNNYSKHKVNLKISNAKFWWPNEYGDPNLYLVRIAVKDSGYFKETSFGIRTVELVLKEKDKNIFIFKINGVKLWAKGANWVPTDILTNFSEEAKYRKLLEMAKSANFNMLRVWGGGVVESDDFYNICDELGIMLWHDFQFACSVYPETKEYLANVEKEIKSIILRLRNHPCIVLWNGNNENEWKDFEHFTPIFRKESGLGEKLHHLKQRLCKELDPSRPYWRSSPWSPTSETDYEFDPNSPEEGNRHNWEVWHGKDQPNFQPPEYEHYYEERGKFVTEYGIQSLPTRSTITKIFSTKTRQQPNDVWEFHNCVFDKIKVNMKKMGEPKDIDEWILFSQAAQAFGMKYAIDIWRARKWDMAGSLIWQFNEPWPTICWSLIDYFDNPKMSYFFVKRAFSPILPVFDPISNTITVINDTLKDIEGKLTIKEYSFSSDEIQRSEYNIEIKANSKTCINFNTHSESDIVNLSFQGQGSKYNNFTLLRDPAKLQIPEPELKVSFDIRNNTLMISSQTLAFVIQIDPNLEPEDNFIIVFPDETVKISIKNPPNNNKCLIKVWSYPAKLISLNN
ncbi:MAG: beta-mannosidase [Candidatus Hodarchaeales archaeon]